MRRLFHLDTFVFRQRFFFTLPSRSLIESETFDNGFRREFVVTVVDSNSYPCNTSYAVFVTPCSFLTRVAWKNVSTEKFVFSKSIWSMKSGSSVTSTREIPSPWRVITCDAKRVNSVPASSHHRYVCSVYIAVPSLN